MRYNRVIQLIASVTAIACILIIGLVVHPRVNTERKQQKLGFIDVRGNTLPPKIALVNMTGPFRGLALDALWHRSSKLQDLGRYFEANQLANWITTLQPRFPTVWYFQAWNMAFNISVETHTAEERWYWINNGIKLLRDQAIPYNPHATGLYRELGWLFFFKIGNTSDNYHWYYKARLAEEWQLILGTPTEGATADEAYEAFKPIADAVYDDDALVAEVKLIAKHPSTADILSRLTELGYDRDIHLLKQLGRIVMFNRSPNAKLLGLTIEQLDQHVDPKLVDLVSDEQFAQGFSHFLPYLQHRILRINYNMDPQFMLQLMQPLTAEDVDIIFSESKAGELQDRLQIGPMDWRNPASHSAYWTVLGVMRTRETADEKLGMKNIDMLNTYRECVHSIQYLKRHGVLYFDVYGQQMDMLPDPRFIPAYELVWKSAKDDISSGKYGRFNDNPYGPGHENFLLDAVMESYFYGEMEQAEFYREKARKLFEGKGMHQYDQPLDEFVLERMKQDIDMMAQARQFITGMLSQGFRQGLANNRMNVFDRFVNLSRKMHLAYQQERSFKNPELAARDRLVMESFDTLLKNNYTQFMRSPQEPVLLQARVWSNTPNTLKLKVYDDIEGFVTERCQQMEIDPAKAFPAPEGIDDYRKKVRKQTDEQLKQKDGQTPIGIKRY